MSQIPTCIHDDGVFRFEQELAFGEISIIECAKQIIADHQEREKKHLRTVKLKVPKGISSSVEEYRDVLIDLVGKKGYYGPSLFTATTKKEHRDAEALAGFYEWPMPSYSDDKTMLRIHCEHCWDRALLNAFRIIDMTDDQAIPLPNFWEKIQIDSTAQNYSKLLASAAYFMGRYHAMALAAESASVAMRGREMSGGRKGKLKPLGKIIAAACDQVRSEQKGFPERVLPSELMDILKKQGLGSTKNAQWHIKVEGKWQEVDGKKLGAHISRYRKSHGG